MNMNRRFFLKGAIALTAVTIVLPKLIVHRIVGDGLHDDAPGLNALLRGEPVSIEMEGIRLSPEGGCVIRGGNFLLSGPLYVPDRKGGTFITDCRFYLREATLPALIVSGQERIEK